jgi:Yip1-like protein
MNLLGRVKGILVDPKAEWPRIEGEPGDMAYLFANYVAVLAAIPAVCGWIAWIVVGAPVFTGIVITLIRYLLSFVSVYLVALIIDALAPTFDADKKFDNALKLAVYSATPFWLSGVFSLVPGLGFVRILALVYSAYLLWLGIPPLTRAPPDKSIGYAGAIVGCALAIGVIFLVIAGLLGMSRPF